jgi:hypothetical protein
LLGPPHVKTKVKDELQLVSIPDTM